MEEEFSSYLLRVIGKRIGMTIENPSTLRFAGTSFGFLKGRGRMEISGFRGDDFAVLPREQGRFQRLCSARSSLAMALAAAWPRWTAVIGCGSALVLLGLIFIIFLPTGSKWMFPSS